MGDTRLSRGPRIGSWLLVLLAIVGCGRQSAELPNPFLLRTDQPVNERSWVSSSPDDSLNLTKMGLGHPMRLAVYDDSIFVPNNATGRIAIVSVSGAGAPRWIGAGKGEGPGEVPNLIDVDVNQDYVLFPLGGIGWHLYDHAGSLITTVQVESRLETARLLRSSGSAVLGLSIGTGSDILVVGGDAAPLNLAEDVSEVLENPLRYAGRIDTRNGDFCFAGYFEPIIKCYRDGDLVPTFATTTIDNNDNANAFVTSGVSGGRTRIAIGPEALPSTDRIAMADDYVAVVPLVDGSGGRLSVVDFYESPTGTYVSSIRPETGQITDVSVDGGWVFVLVQETDATVVLRYPEPELDRALLPGSTK